MQTVYLHDTLNPITISDSAFALIKELTLQNKVCRWCEKPYKDDRPEVAANSCLYCFVERYEKKPLAFLESEKIDQEESRQFKFIDPEGYLVLTTAKSYGEPGPSIFETIKGWGFPLPETVTIGDTTIPLGNQGWAVYGDFRSNSVIVTLCTTEKSTFPFLSYRKGACVYLDKRRGETKKLYLAARHHLRTSKDSEGRYRYKQYESDFLSSSVLYPLIADLASAQYDKPQQERT